jgi:glycosyltransferase involved in cell wall biosynthesis
MAKSSEKVSVIIPARDEVKSIGKLIARTRTSLSQSRLEVIVIDDGSHDNTRETAEAKGATVISHVKSLGKGAAMKTGASVANGDILVFIDGDGAHNPEDIPQVIKPVFQNKAGLVIGSRDFRGSNTFGSYLPRVITNKIASFITSLIISWMLPMANKNKRFVKWIKVEDAECGFKAVRKKDWNQFNLVSKGFEIESEIIYEAAKNGLVLRNIPISCNWDCRVSRLSIIKDGAKTLKLMFNKLNTDRDERKAIRSASK